MIEKKLKEWYIFKKKGEYPKTLNYIFKMSEIVPAENVLDVDCDFGLLTHRLATVYNHVVGIGQNSEYAKKFILKENITYYNFKINKESILDINKIIKKHNIQAVYFRRVIPELYDKGGFELLHYLKEVLYQNNVEYIILEGRYEQPNSKHPFKDCEKECSYFEDKYKLIHRYKQCAVLKLKKKENE